MKLRILLLIAVFFALYGFGTTPAHAGGLYNLAFSVSKTTLVAGEVFNVTATVTDQNGVPMPTLPLSYVRTLLDGQAGVSAELADGTVTFQYIYGAFGTHTLQGKYCGPDNTCNGDAEDVTSNPISITVTKANSSTSVVASDTAIAGKAIPIAIKVSPVAPASNSLCSNGVVEISTNQYQGTAIAVKITIDTSVSYATLQSVAGTCSGKVTVNKAFSVGTHKVTISYPGSGNYNPSSATFYVSVDPITK